ncbi:cysteine-rich secretory protein 1-like [Peromyscus maniculatus bairdii]|uniref:cysteine-rich secretory protein 1-like n=1 Tax=Peromyscus maniculatus bairdii TaxID=230844 RepID=UPI003FD1D246
MKLSPLLLFLAALLSPSILNNDSDTWNMEIEHLQTTRKSVQEEIVKKHNQLRRMVSPPGSDLLNMKWDNYYQLLAQMTAHTCTLFDNRGEFWTKNRRCGENFFVSQYPVSWSCAIQSWYDESIDYTVGSDSFPDGYTQIVRSSSYKVACGVAKCRDQSYKFMYYCSYCPLGKMERKTITPYTIGQPCALCPDHCEDGLCTNTCEYEDAHIFCAELKASLTCEYPEVKEQCKATCKCEGKFN